MQNLTAQVVAEGCSSILSVRTIERKTTILFDKDIMAKFIEVTDYNDQCLYINVDNILWVKPYNAENGSIIYVPVPGRNDYPVSLTVKESYAQVIEAIGC